MEANYSKKTLSFTINFKEPFFGEEDTCTADSVVFLVNNNGYELVAYLPKDIDIEFVLITVKGHLDWSEAIKEFQC